MGLGRQLSMTLRLKAVPTEKESATARLVRDAKMDLQRRASESANAMAARFSETTNLETRQAVNRLIESHNSKARGMFAGLSEAFAEACYETPAKLLQRGDPALEENIGEFVPWLGSSGTILHPPDRQIGGWPLAITNHRRIETSRHPSSQFKITNCHHHRHDHHDH